MAIVLGELRLFHRKKIDVGNGRGRYRDVPYIWSFGRDPSDVLYSPLGA